MCPDPQLLSIYLDGELPSPWKEKMQEHFSQCPVCKEKLENFKRLQALFKEDKTLARTFVERVLDEPAERRTYSLTEEELLRSKEKVWEKIESRRGFRRRPSVWQRRLSIPLPAVAAAAVIILLFAVFRLNGTGGAANRPPSVADAQRGTAQQLPVPIERTNYILAAEMEKIDEISGLIPSADMSGILQYLAPQNTGANIIILQLPESKNFSRTGEPAIIRAADFSDRQRDRRQR